jgi:hypothetical protein
VLDHLLVDFITAVQQAFERALLQRQAVEERFQVDGFLGDVSWETSYSLPGEERPARIRADISVDWPTWSQTAYRSWSIGEPPDELPEVVLEVALRVQRIAERPDISTLLSLLPSQSPPVGSDPLTRSSTIIEDVHLDGPRDDDADAQRPPRWAVEATYEGSVRFDERNLEDVSTILPMVESLTRWIASTLVMLADLPLRYVPPDGEDL